MKHLYVKPLPCAPAAVSIIESSSLSGKMDYQSEVSALGVIAHLANRERIHVVLENVQ